MTERIINELWELYIPNGPMHWVALQLEAYARRALDSVPLASNIEQARALSEVHEFLIKRDFTQESNVRRHLAVHRALTKDYVPVVHDVLLVSAFELLAKASLIRRSLVVHEIKEPIDLSDMQRKIPIHRNTLRARQKLGETIVFSNRTIGLSVLLGSKYRKHYPLSNLEYQGLKEARERRNLIHFQVHLLWNVSKSLIEFAAYLGQNIPKFINGRRQRSA